MEMHTASGTMPVWPGLRCSREAFSCVGQREGMKEGSGGWLGGCRLGIKQQEGEGFDEWLIV